MPSDLTNFQPRRREISAVENSEQPLITTTEDHGYSVGLVVRLIVPEAYGMSIPRKIATILSVPNTNQFMVDYDTSREAPYVTPTAPPSFTQAHVVPVTGLTDNETSITV